MADLAEADLIERARQGEPQALGALYDHHHRHIFRYLWARVGQRPLAEDLTSDVFLRLLLALPRYEARGQPFRAWLYQIARNLLIDHFRKPSTRAAVALEAAGALTSPHTPEAQTEQTLTMAAVHHALAQLEPDQREVVILRFLNDLPIKEVAQTLGKTEAAVKALQHRGLLNLRQALAEEAPQP